MGPFGQAGGFGGPDLRPSLASEIFQMLTTYKVIADQCQKRRKKVKITQAEWAREKGFSRQYVCSLVKKGIVELKDGLIDQEQANEAVAAIRDPSQPLRRKNYSESGEKLSMILLKTRIKNETERGKLLEAKVKAEIGKFVSIEEVKTEAFNVARVVRNNLLNIPNRVSALLASLSDTEKIHMALTEEITNSLEELSNTKF